MAQVSSKFGDTRILWGARIRNTEEVAVLAGKTRLAIYDEYLTLGKGKNRLKFYYAFSDNIRNPYAGARKYGGDGVTFRWLYSLLSLKSYGNSFLNKYFGARGAVYTRLAPEIAELKQAIFSYDTDGRHINPLRGRTKSGKFYHISQASIDRKLVIFSHRVRKDCIMWLRAGGAGTIRGSTMERRLDAGIHGEARYYATGQLINDMQLTVVAGEGE